MIGGRNKRIKTLERQEWRKTRGEKKPKDCKEGGGGVTEGRPTSGNLGDTSHSGAKGEKKKFKTKPEKKTSSNGTTMKRRYVSSGKNREGKNAAASKTSS